MVDFSPAIAQSLEFILKYDGEDLKDMLNCTFSVDVDNYGKKSVAELKPNGANIYVTKENREEYVKLYIDWLFEKYISSPFEAFKKASTNYTVVN